MRWRVALIAMLWRLDCVRSAAAASREQELEVQALHDAAFVAELARLRADGHYGCGEHRTVASLTA